MDTFPNRLALHCTAWLLFVGILHAVRLQTAPLAFPLATYDPVSFHSLTLVRSLYSESLAGQYAL